MYCFAFAVKIPQHLIKCIPFESFKYKTCVSWYSHYCNCLLFDKFNMQNIKEMYEKLVKYVAAFYNFSQINLALKKVSFFN